MSLLSFRSGSKSAPVSDLLTGYSIEVMPRTAAKIPDFKALLPQGTRVYIAHIEGTPIEDMVATAKRLNADGFPVMPHFPARIIKDRATLGDWIARYQGEADVRQGLILAGGVAKPHGDYDSAIQLLGSGAFDAAGFTHLHVAGHPEGNRDIDPQGGTRNVDEALAWKQGFSEQTDAQMAIATQFAFEAGPIADWADDLHARGITLPIHLGIAGPAKLQTMIKFALACGVGPSLKVLQKRAMDVSKLLLPYEPTDMLVDLARLQAAGRAANIEQIHLFPLGGITASIDYAARHGASARTATA
ncbi:MAG: 5,10-methylenetetrahydrofolate reductase [Rhodobacterales bacterium]|nr:MAG: 5,10-methylenetetrahydrofolate reductase [Rhodobacterales bacterium]